MHDLSNKKLKTGICDIKYVELTDYVIFKHTVLWQHQPYILGRVQNGAGYLLYRVKTLTLCFL